MLSMVILTSQAAPLVPAESALLQANALADYFADRLLTADYTKYTSRGCSGKNELGTSYPKDGLGTCAALCDIDDACVSFEMSSSGKCQLSNSCQYSDSVASSSSWTLYVKSTQTPSRYTAKSGYGCTGKNDGGTSSSGGLNACKSMCDWDSACVSFEFAVDGTNDGKCQLSSSCTASDATSNDGNWNIYFKKASPVYTRYGSRGCTGKNELGTSYPKGGLGTCSALCDVDPTCVSFEMTSSGKCQLSNSCQYSDSVASSSSWTLYVKNVQVGDGYTAKSGYGCTGKNELGTSEPKGGLHECKALCDSEDECVSFEFAVDGTNDGKCQLSSSCTASDATSNDGNWNIYFKKASPVYTRYGSRGCTGKNELGTSEPKGGLHECKALCDSEDECVSFEFAIDGTNDGKCQLSSSCTASDATSNGGNWNVYFKTPPSPLPAGPGEVCSPTCTTAVWNAIAQAKNGREHSCGSRIMFRVNKFSGDYDEACAHVARNYPSTCGPCGA